MTEKIQWIIGGMAISALAATVGIGVAALVNSI